MSAVPKMEPLESLAWALNRLATLQGAVLDPLQLRSGLHQCAGVQHPAELLVLLCRLLGVGAPQGLRRPDAAHLPLLCHLPDGQWGIVTDLAPTGDWMVACGTVTQAFASAALQDRCTRMQLAPAGSSAVSGHPVGPAPAETFRSRRNAAIRPYRGALIEACVGSVMVGLLALATSMFSMQVYDRVIPTRGEYTLFVLATGVLISVLIELAVKIARARVMDHVVVGVDGMLSRDIFHRLMSLRIDQVPASVGSLAAQIRGYEQVRAFYTASSLFALVDLPMALVFVAIVMALATPAVGLVLLGFALVALFIGLASQRRIARQAKEGAAYANLKTGLLVEAVEGAETIKAGAGGWRFLSRWLDVSARTIANDLKMRHLSENVGYLGGSIQQLSYASLIVVGALTVMHGEMTTGALIACSILSGRILNPILAVPGLMIQRAHALAAEDGLEKLYQLKTDNHGVRRPLAPERIEGRFALEDVSFAYGDNPVALRVPNLRIQPGERIAVVGPIGSGKSTLLRVLTGMYVPQSGRVLLDDLDLSHISRLALSRQIGYLQQDHRLFQGTLRENLLIGLPDPGDEEILRAMRRTGMDRIVAAHPKGLDRPIVEGGRGLSGGQRQLVAFTRLVLCRPRIILLDEPTASMDDDQERRCLGVLAEEARAGATLVVVTHKPNVLPLVERVVVMIGNGIVRDGPRDAVLKDLEAARRDDDARRAAGASLGVAGAQA